MSTDDQTPVNGPDDRSTDESADKPAKDPAAAAAGPAHLRRAPRSLGRRRAALGVKLVAALSSLGILFYSGWAWSIVNQANDSATRVGIKAGGKIVPHTEPPATGSGPTPSPQKATQPSDIDGKDQNILLVGNDDRSGYTNAQLYKIGTAQDGGGFNTDTILVLHVPADGSKATIVSIPRDSWVNIPDYRDGKINGAYPDGACLPLHTHKNLCNGKKLTKKQMQAGAELLIQTVSNLTGVTIDHYVEISLLGFYNLSNSLGGVNICLKKNVNDPVSGLKMSAGHHRIKGTQALQFVRQRHHFPVGADDGDLNRIHRQQAFLGAAVDQIISAHWLVEPWRLNKVVGSVTGALTVDDDLDIVKLAEQMRNLAAGNVTFTTMPTDGPAPEDSDSLAVSPTQVRAFFRQVIGADDAPASPKPTKASTRAPVKTSVTPSKPVKPSASTRSSAPPKVQRVASDNSCVY